MQITGADTTRKLQPGDYQRFKGQSIACHPQERQLCPDDHAFCSGITAMRSQERGKALRLLMHLSVSSPKAVLRATGYKQQQNRTTLLFRTAAVCGVINCLDSGQWTGFHCKRIMTLQSNSFRWLPLLNWFLNPWEHFHIHIPSGLVCLFVHLFGCFLGFFFFDWWKLFFPRILQSRAIKHLPTAILSQPQTHPFLLTNSTNEEPSPSLRAAPAPERSRQTQTSCRPCWPAKHSIQLTSSKPNHYTAPPLPLSKANLSL